jgi:hypothetical protein
MRTVGGWFACELWSGDVGLDTPGKVCHYDDGITTRPSEGRVVLIAVLAATSPVAFVSLRRRREGAERRS